MVWDKPKILKTIKQLHKSGKDLSYNAMCRRMQSLVSAAAYHFGSYRDAVARAGVDYASVTRRPRWTRQAIIQLIKRARRRGEDLHWSAVTERRDELGRAAFASLQPRLFGRWDRALTAAGLDADQIAQYRKWDRTAIVAELRHRLQEEEPLNSGALQHEDPGLHAAAVRHFGSYDAALQAARINPQRVRQRRTWTKPQVLAALKKAMEGSKPLNNSTLRHRQPALYGAAIRLFGSFTAARTAAGLKPAAATPRGRARKVKK